VGDTIGLVMHDLTSGPAPVLRPRAGQLEPQVEAAMQAADVVLVDGTFWTEDEMIRMGLSSKRAADMGHLPQSGPGGMIEVLDRLPRSTRKVLIHINNTNPILREDSAERAELTAHGIEVAHDGLEILW
jgi:pyrroloquinoline quinone biosynthesis protein B